MADGTQISEMRYQALTPTAWFPDVNRSPLAKRLESISGRTVCFITFNIKDALVDEFVPALMSTFQDQCKSHCVLKTKTTPSMSDDEELWQEVSKEADTFLFFGTSMPSQTAHAAIWSAELERRGIPGATIIFEMFHRNAAQTSERLGMSLRLIDLPYSLDKLDGEDYQDIVDRIYAALTSPLSMDESRTGTEQKPRPPRIALQGSADEVQDYYYEAGWTDGLPIIIPTEENLARMLAGTRHEPGEIVTSQFPPEGLQASVEKIAINGIMAGCRPQHLPVLLAAAEAFAVEDNEPKVVSSNSFAFMMVVNGPIRKEIGMNCGVNALGPGNLANATIGRALRLFIHGLGGGRPGENIMATQGNVANYSFCFAENEEHSPWEPFHVSQGYRNEESTITIFNGGSCHVGNFGFEGYENLAEAIALFEHPEGAVILVSPEKAGMFAQRGLSKSQLEQEIWSRATTTMKRFKSNSFYTSFVESNLKGVPWGGEQYLWPGEYLGKSDDELVQVFPRKFLRVIVVGGETRDVMQAWRMSRPVTVSIDKWR